MLIMVGFKWVRLMSDTENTEQRQDDANKNKKPGEALVGKVLFDKYEVLEVLGESAMALVLKARIVTDQRLVAIKTVTPHDQEVVKRFAQEVQLHRLLNHPNIVEAIDCLETAGGRTFFIMEFMYGASLHKVLQKQKRINNEEDLGAILLQVCDALEHAHKSGVLHRDLKPGNIYLLEKDNKLNVKVLDFGIAKPMGQQTGLTQAGYAVGSPLYMSPEQCRGQKVDFRSDVYSLGILAYEMTTGNLPYGGQNIMTVMAAHCDPDRKPTALEQVVPELRRVNELNAAIQTSMETDPAKRFQTIGEFRSAIQRWHEGVQADLLSSLVSGQSLNLAPETKVAVAEHALKSAGATYTNQNALPQSAATANPALAPAPAAPPAPVPQPVQEEPAMNFAPEPAPPPVVKESAPASHTGSSVDIENVGYTDRMRIESVNLTAEDQKSRIRTRLNVAKDSTEVLAKSDKKSQTKMIFIAVGVVMAILLIALLAMGKSLLQ